MPPDSTPFGLMRRKDREMTDRADIDAVIAAGNVMHLALADEGRPFVVPVFYAYDGQALYFHSARGGTKIALLQKNPQVCFCITLDHGIVVAESACDFEASHRTVIGYGQALDLIVARFSPRRFEYPAANLKATTVVRIAIASVTGKRHGV